MKTILANAAFAAVLFAVRLAGAETSITPPAGWEVPPLKTASEKPTKAKKKIGPACCAFDSTCCSRQTDIDAGAKPQSVARVITLRLADLPEAKIREVAEGEPPIEDAPPVRLVNEDQQPFPWSRTPKQIRMFPPGPVGEIGWNSQWGPSPSFDEEEFRGYGWGDVHFLDEAKPYAPDAEIAGKVEYLSVALGEGDKLVLDIAKGTISGSPKLKATYHLHSEAAHVTDKVVHAYRATTKEKDTATNWVNFLMPQTIDGFESKDAKHQGGFFPSRFSRRWSYSIYRLPYGPGRSNLATFRLDDDDMRTWIGVSKVRKPKIMMRRVLVAVSQTSVEPEPQIRVMLFDEFSFNF